ncbi:MAG: DegV family protein [Angelakisella sp.]
MITDSASDIPKSEWEELGIKLMPIPITIDGVTYRESVDFTGVDYYPMLAAAKDIPTHAQVTMIEFIDEYKKAAAEGFDGVICVTITSKGSGIYDAACLAKKLLLEEQPELAEHFTIDVVDSKAYTYVYGMAVVAAARASREGKCRDEVMSVLREALDHYTAAVGLFNLFYAKKSGRITTVAAFVGDIMGFRPILCLEDGALVTRAKVRGDSKLIEEMASLYKKQSAEDGRPYYIICADSMPNAELLQKAIGKLTKNPFGGFYRIGAAVTTNSGPTIIGFVQPT